MYRLLLFLLCIASAARAQPSPRISITLTDGRSPLENATVELLAGKDSGLVKTALTDKNGLAYFEPVADGSYLLRLSALGFQPAYTKQFTVNGASIELPSIQLQAIASQLQGVTVTGRKPFIQKLQDRIVVNVENSLVSAGSSAMDVLERAPGVTVDQNDLISLRGRSGVIIMIDGKPTALTGADLASYLKGLPSNAIERIDIITNPSARYDAAGNSGIIDIRMKKDQRFGTNGTLTAGYGQGVYPKYNSGFTFNRRTKRSNVFGNYNYAYRKNLNHLFINRNFFENGQSTGSDNKNNYAIMPFRSSTMRLGADFFPSGKTIIGFVVNANFNHFRRSSDNGTTINDAASQPASRFRTEATNNDHARNAVGNINFKHRFDSTGRELTADIDYGIYHSFSITRTASAFYNLNGTKAKDDDILDGDQDGELKLRTAKIDYTHPMKKGAKLEAGLKTSYVSSDNDARFYNVFPNITEVDSTKTNRFYYQEYNHAGYANYSRTFKRFDMQIGLRGEATRINTRQQKGDRRFANHYFQWFPSAFFNYKLNDDESVGVSVSRRIDRPGYSALNPFLFQIDATIYATGQPLLKPQLTWSYELNYTRKSWNLNLAYTRSTDVQDVVLSRILDVIPNFEIKPGQDSNITVQIPVNLRSADYVGLTASLPVRVNKWWNMTNNANVYYNTATGTLGGATASNGGLSADLRTDQSFSFGKGWSAELNANLSTGGRYGYNRSKAQGALSAGGQKTVLKGKGTLRLNVTDIFWTNRPGGTVTYSGRYLEHWHAYRETRVANLSFTYRFGSSKVQQARRRTTGSEEERQRAG